MHDDIGVVPVWPWRFAQVKLQAQTWVQLRKPREQRRDMGAAIAERRGDSERSGQLLIVALQRFAQAVELLQQLVGLAAETLAFGGELQLARRAVGQHQPQRGLELAQAHRQRRRGDTQRARGGTQGTLAQQRCRKAKIVDLHIQLCLTIDDERVKTQDQDRSLQ